jgi:hypothetical protein
MKSQVYLLSLFLLLTTALNAYAQQPKSGAEDAEKLRLQLLDVQTQEEGLRAKAAQLDEALKPENIERSLAGVGSTKPEDLREARRRQLQIERDAVTAQLKVLETSRTRLESAIRDADARAYHESARPASENALVSKAGWGTRWLLSGSIGAVVAGLAAGIFVRRRLRNRVRN